MTRAARTVALAAGLALLPGVALTGVASATGSDGPSGGTTQDVAPLAPPQRPSDLGYLGYLGYSVELVLGPEQVERLAGRNRSGTAAAVSAATYPEGAGTVYVAAGTDYPDALVGGAAAAEDGGPLLLVRQGEIPGATAAELERLAPEQIHVLGGAAAVSQTVLDELAASTGATVERVGGKDRYRTAALLAQQFAPGSPVMVATGQDYPDALSAAAAAGVAGGPVLLVRADSIPGATSAALEALEPSAITVVGGADAVSGTVLTGLEAFGTVERVSGEDRYRTAAAVAARFVVEADTALVASGEDWPDALVGAARAGALAEPLLLVRQGEVPGATAEVLVDLTPATIHVVGGEAALTGPVLDALRALNYVE